MFVQASLTLLALLHTSLATALPPSDGPIAEREPLDPNAELLQRAALAFPMPKLPALAIPDAAKGVSNCPSTSTGSQTNMCQSGTPYCCSGDGNGGTLHTAGSFQPQPNMLVSQSG